jgi:hypothetical protein
LRFWVKHLFYRCNQLIFSYSLYYFIIIILLEVCINSSNLSFDFIKIFHNIRNLLKKILLFFLVFFITNFFDLSKINFQLFIEICCPMKRLLYWPLLFAACNKLLQILIQLWSRNFFRWWKKFITGIERGHITGITLLNFHNFSHFL